MLPVLATVVPGIAVGLLIGAIIGVCIMKKCAKKTGMLYIQPHVLYSVWSVSLATQIRCLIPINRNLKKVKSLTYIWQHVKDPSYTNILVDMYM